jgi:hypothetical protein
MHHFGGVGKRELLEQGHNQHDQGGFLTVTKTTNHATAKNTTEILYSIKKKDSYDFFTALAIDSIYQNFSIFRVKQLNRTVCVT